MSKCCVLNMEKEKRIAFALLDIQVGMSIRAAAKKYHLPNSTLRNRKINPFPSPVAPPTLFSEWDEILLRNLLRGFEDFLIPLTPSKFLGIVRDLARAREAWWFDNTEKKLKTLSDELKFTEDDAEEWIKRLKGQLKEDRMKDPRGIINLDESGFQTGVKDAKVICSKGRRNVPAFTKGDEREQITVLVGGSASGEPLIPLVIYKGKSFLQEWLQGTNNEILFAVNNTGNMDAQIFSEYLEIVVIPYLLKLNPAVFRPTIFVDGHFSHVYNIKALERCMMHGIALICLPSGQTSKFQPLDVALFGHIKKLWKKYQREIDHSGDEIRRNNFPNHFAKVWKTINFRKYLPGGFSQTGLFPFNPDLIRARVYKVPIISPPRSLSPQFSSYFEEMKAATKTLCIKYGLHAEDVRITQQAVKDSIDNSFIAKNMVAVQAAKILDLATAPKKEKKDGNGKRIRLRSGELLSSTCFMEKLLDVQMRQNAAKEASTQKKKIIAEKRIIAAARKAAALEKRKAIAQKKALATEKRIAVVKKGKTSLPEICQIEQCTE